MHELMNCRVRVTGKDWNPKNHPATWWVLNKIGTVTDYVEEEDLLRIELPDRDISFFLKEEELVIAGPDDCDEEAPEAELIKWDRKGMAPFDMLLMRNMILQ